MFLDAVCLKHYWHDTFPDMAVPKLDSESGSSHKPPLSKYSENLALAKFWQTVKMP